MVRAKYIAAFIGHEPGKGLFVGLFSNMGSQLVKRQQFWNIPAHNTLKSFGMKFFVEESRRSSLRRFNLVLTDFYAHWKGKLVVGWPRPDRNWHRWAYKPKNRMPVVAVLDDSALDAAMPEWTAIDLEWVDLGILPTRWKLKLAEWRGIYYIFDRSDRKGYVGSAFGRDNILGRWTNYAKGGHGGNKLLRKRDPANFQFTILQRVSPDMGASNVTQLEATWKKRLHTRQPFGLNDN